MSLTEQRRASVTGTVAWDDATPFNGYALVLCVLPTYTSSTASPSYATAFMGDDFPQVRVPLKTRIPIINGEFADDAKLWFTADLTPPNTRYCTWYYDASGRLVNASPTALFQVTADPTTLTVPTLAVPVAPTGAPSSP